VRQRRVSYLRTRCRTTEDVIRVEARSAWLITVQEGKQTSLILYQTKREAIEAAGLSK
jgi:hypothetical protein